MSSFFLIGKGPDNELVLLSPEPVATRKDALSELSKLTAAPGFDHWDAEVFVLDLETGTPVLLMRPEVPAAETGMTAEPADETAELEEPESVEPSEDASTEEDLAEEDFAAAVEELPVQAQETPDEHEQLIALEEIEVEGDEPVLVSEAAPEVLQEAAEEPEVDEALAAVIEDLAAETPEDATVAEAPEPVVAAGEAVEAAIEPPAAEAPTESVEAAYAEAVVEAAVEETSSLKAALERTAAQMAASGITPPESVGPADASDAAGIEAPAEPLAPEAAWPWATSTDDDGATFTIAALEEPGVDEGSLVRAAGDDETMAVSRPVILGAYGEAPDSGQIEDTASSEAVPGFEATPNFDVEPAAPVVDEPVEQTTPEVESDFILDLEQIAASHEPEPAGYQPADAPREMTCNDCVYVETCPNKDQRDPTSCGSFQWK